MPEQISKYPEVTLEVLRGAGASCGQGGPQKILKQCPAERFCSLPSGEICVYGVNEIAQMTQIKPQELGAIADHSPLLDALVLCAVFLIGLALGAWWQRRRAKTG
jgi:hypothetical protein